MHVRVIDKVHHILRDQHLRQLLVVLSNEWQHVSVPVTLSLREFLVHRVLIGVKEEHVGGAFGKGLFTEGLTRHGLVWCAAALLTATFLGETVCFLRHYL